ncbi:unnamed protein product [Gordionus sp. m RMFG-2023]|uniref:protein N-terminal asparagine amidohydrolase-like n=1 Tax=Gordionus sp. m RMFG-2023 TaxID=3053472 RepID=UPI0030E022FC
MPLIIDDIEIKIVPNDIDKFIDYHVYLKERSLYIINQVLIGNNSSVKTFYSSNFITYVHQREYAIIDSDYSKTKIIGSDEATTCHIVLIKNRNTSILCLVHIDNEYGIKAWLLNVVKGMIELSNYDNNIQTFDIWLYCGYKDEGNVSQKISLAVLDALINFSYPNKTVEFILQCLCTGSINTRYMNPPIELSTNSSYNEDKITHIVKDTIPLPIITGMAYQLSYPYKKKYYSSVNKAMKDFFNPFPALFEDKGPDYLLRSARNFVSYNECATEDIKYYKYFDITDIPKYFTKSEKNFTDYLHFDFHLCKIHNGDKLSNLTDSMILHNFSTSPLAESKNFVPRLRKMFKLLQIRHDTKGKEGSIPENFIKHANTYKMDNHTGEWLLV